MEHLIPDAWFQGQPVFVLLILTCVALYVLGTGADWLVESATGIAHHVGVPKVVIGATIVSLGTTTPECAVSVMAAWQGDSGLALGNAVGSVIADTALIFGLGCLLVRLPADRFILSRQGWVQFGSAVLLAAFCYGQYAMRGQEAAVTRPMGLLLLGLLAVYLAVSIRWSRQHPDGMGEQEGLGGVEGEVFGRAPLLPLFGWLLCGLVLVLLASRVAIGAVTEFAVTVGVPQVVISATLVAFGTSLPELVVGWTSIRRGQSALLVGNVVGADVLNILFVTGAAAAAAPLPILSAVGSPTIFLTVHLPFMLGILLYFRICIFLATREGRFSHWMGWPLVTAYVAYSVVQFVV